VKVQATRLGKRKKAPDWGSAIIHEIIAETVKEPQFKREPKEIVDNWQNKPKFTLEVALNAVKMGYLTVGYLIKGTELARNIWNWLDKGTRPHKIRAKNAPTLVFQWGGPGSYKPKTKPGGRTLSFGGPGTVAGGTTHRPIEVDHPGNEPREFYIYLGNKLLPRWKTNIRVAIRRGLRNANAGKVYPPLSETSKITVTK